MRLGSKNRTGSGLRMAASNNPYAFAGEEEQLLRDLPIACSGLKSNWKKLVRPTHGLENSTKSPKFTLTYLPGMAEFLRTQFGQESQTFATGTTVRVFSYSTFILGDIGMRKEMTSERARALIYVISRPANAAEGDPLGVMTGINHAALWSERGGLNYALLLKATMLYQQRGRNIARSPLPKLMDYLWQNNPNGAVSYLDEISESNNYKQWYREILDLCSYVR